jgi:hypothetical protein
MKFPQAASGASGVRSSPPTTSNRSLGADRVRLPQIPASSPAAQRTEQLARLAYELLDAHVDLQRTAREILADATHP